MMYLAKLLRLKTSYFKTKRKYYFQGAHHRDPACLPPIHRTP